MQTLERAALAAAFLLCIACRGGGPAAPAAQARIVLNTDSPRPTIDVVDIPEDQLGRIYGTDAREAWNAILKISVGADPAAAVGQYAIEENRIRFTPMFPLDRGRQYHVTFTPPGGQPVSTTVGLPAADTTPTTLVTQVYPTAGVLPQNQRRFYLDFSAPMERRSALDLVHLVDGTGKDLKDAFLPLTADAWNEDRTRYTVGLDPDRGSLVTGQSYTLILDGQWLDGHGLSLKQGFRRTFTVGAPDQDPPDPKTWKIAPPAAATTDPLIVTFPEPLDHGVLIRALSVVGTNGKPLAGEAIVGPGELTWEFTPDEPWKAGAHNLATLPILEDLAGHSVGRAALVPFSVRQ